MKTSCSNCGAIYNVKEDKIPDRGVKSKCKKCHSVFTITKPDQTPPELKAAKQSINKVIKEVENHHSRSGAGQNEVAISARIKLEDRVKSGASWFYWIAALSIINSVILLANGEWSFIFGLGATQIVDGLALGFIESAPDLQSVAVAVAFIANLTIVTIFALFGFFARKSNPWAFWVGMVLYGLDGLLFLLFADYLSFGFHVFALWGMYGGLRALRELGQTAEFSSAFGAKVPG